MTSIKTDTFKSNRGLFERLNNDNHPQWANSICGSLKAEDLWEMITGEEICPADADETVIRKHRNKQRQAAALLHNACSVSVRLHIRKEENPKKIWDTLKIRLDSAASDHGRQTLKTKLYSTKPVAGESILIQFEELLLIRDELAGSTEEVDNALLNSIILNSIPCVYKTTLRINISCGNDTNMEFIMNAVKEDESKRTMRNQPPAASDAFYARHNRDPETLEIIDIIGTTSASVTIEIHGIIRIKEANIIDLRIDGAPTATVELTTTPYAIDDPVIHQRIQDSTQAKNAFLTVTLSVSIVANKDTEQEIDQPDAKEKMQELSAFDEIHRRTQNQQIDLQFQLATPPLSPTLPIPALTETMELASD
jgi:hypothetical protein